MKFTFESGTRPLDGYTIQRAIHRGGFGEVYYALSDEGREVALKLLQHNSDIELRGVRQCFNLSHPHLVTIFDIRTDAEGDHWVVMEYVDGETLDQAIRRAPHGMTIQDAAAWLEGITSGVEYLHSRGLVHRDLKPGNVFCSGTTVKVGDVGLSKFVTPSRRSAHTQSVGTVYYMAPEVSRGRYGREVDVYAAGVILYEMLTGRVPFDGESTAEILMKHLMEKPDLSLLPPSVRGVVGRALEKDPAHRYSSMQGLWTEFSRAISGQGTAQAASSAADRTPHEEAARRAASASHKCSTATGRATPHSAQKEHTGGGCRGTAFVDRACSTISGWQESLRQSPWTWPLLLFLSLANMVLATVGPVGAVLLGVLLIPLVGMAFATAISIAFLILMVLLGVGLARAFLQGWRSLAPAESRPVRSSPDPDRTGEPVRRQRVGDVHPQVYRSIHRRPGWERPISWNTRVMHFTGSAAISTLCAGVLTSALVLFVPDMFHNNAFGMPAYDLSAIGLFVGTTILGSWGISLVTKLYEGRRMDNATRRLLQATMGCLVGACAWMSGQWLMVRVPYLSVVGIDGRPNFLTSVPPSRTILSSIGQQSLLDAGHPSLLCFVLFFAALFGMRRWWHQTDELRPYRFRFGSVFLTMLLAFVICQIIPFPEIWGVTWAAMISCVVQIASVWQSPAPLPTPVPRSSHSRMVA